MKSQSWLGAASIGVATLFISSAAQAGLLGSSVTATEYNPDPSTIVGGPTAPVTVSSAVEFPCCTLPQNGFVDITDNTITYTADEAANFAGGIIFDFSGAPTITDVTLDPLSNSDFLSTGITFTDTSVTFDVTGVTTAAANESLILDVQTAAVPEPFTLSLFGAGLAGAAAMRRRKKAQKA